MDLTDESVSGVGKAFSRAATGEVGWDHALNAMIDLLGMRSGQLVAFGRDSLMPLNMMTRMTDECPNEFLAIDGGNPAVNSKVREGFKRPELTVLDENDYDTAGDRRKTPEFGAWMDRHDIGYCCVSTLVRTPDTLVGLASLQSAAGPPLDEPGKRAFASIAAAARNAVILREAIEEHGLKLAIPSLESARLAAMIVDLSGRVRAMTPSAEAIISAQRFGHVRDGRFVPYRPEDRFRFDRQVRQVLQSWARPAPVSGPCVLTSREGERLAVEMMPMPPEHSFQFSAAALIILKPRRTIATRRAALAAAMFGLTQAETRVTELMLDGLSPAEIALRTGASVGTVRNHVHRILSKADCRSQLSYIALLARYD